MLNVATLKDSTGNSFYGLAIGGTVFVGAVMGGRISGACFNPAVGIGMSAPLLDLIQLGLAAVAKGATGKSSPVWIYILAPMVGSCVAAFYFRITNYKEYMYALLHPMAISSHLYVGYVRPKLRRVSKLQFLTVMGHTMTKLSSWRFKK